MLSAFKSISKEGGKSSNILKVTYSLPEDVSILRDYKEYYCQPQTAVSRVPRWAHCDAA